MHCCPEYLPVGARRRNADSGDIVAGSVSRVLMCAAVAASAAPGWARSAAGPDPAPPASGTARLRLADASTATGTFYVNANGYRLTLRLVTSPAGLTGDLKPDGGAAEPVDNVEFDPLSRALQFRRRGSGFYQWYRGKLVEGVLVGRFSHKTSGARPPWGAAYAFHFSGWSDGYLGRRVVPRVYELLINHAFRARLRLDRDVRGALTGRLKVYATVPAAAAGEEVEDDLEVQQWDGSTLRFVRRRTGFVQTYTGAAHGRWLNGTFRHNGGAALPFSGERAELLTYGLSPKNAADRHRWQARARAQLYHLMMAGAPTPLSLTPVLLRSGLAPIGPQVPSLPHRDDEPWSHPQAYTLSELRLDTTLPNPYGGAPLVRPVHTYLATPVGRPPPGGFPAVVAVNGHGGSARKMMTPSDAYFWYGDGFARRGYVVLAIDISHRPVADRGGLYGGYDAGDDPAGGNGVHPAVRAPGLDSDWEEDGERVWDAMRGVDYVQSLATVNPERIVVAGLSMGGEVASLLAALDPRVKVTVAAGYSPDMGVMRYHGNHPCWRWRHADNREYIDISDVQALIAPRPLVVETGRLDTTFSALWAPFAADKQIARRARAAYAAHYDRPGRYVHYLHYDHHHFHAGGLGSPAVVEHELRVPARLAPAGPSDTSWQTDGATRNLGRTLFEHLEAEPCVGTGADFLWWSSGDGHFQSVSLELGDAFRTLRGDFDGDGNDDLLLYQPGDRADALWWGTGQRVFQRQPLQVRGSYAPVSGDFDGDGAADIVWYGAGIFPDYLWRARANRSFTSRRLDVRGDYEPFSGDFDGDGRDDIFWYGPGASPDFVWWGQADGAFSSQPVSVEGRYVPRAGDFDGDGNADILWYGPGAEPDFLWWSNGNRTFTSQSRPVHGYYAPVVGDFDASMGADILWYGPASGADSIWWAEPGRQFTRQNLLVRGAYEPVSGDFDGDGAADVLWYGTDRCD